MNKAMKLAAFGHALSGLVLILVGRRFGLDMGIAACAAIEAIGYIHWSRA